MVRDVSAASASVPFALLITAASGFLDAYTFLARGGVFANTQTANVIFLALDLAEGRGQEALAHLWPITAFLVGVAIAFHIRQGRLDHLPGHPIRWTITVQAIVLVVVGFVPTTVDPSFVTIPIAFVGALQIELFRSIGQFSYVAVAVTGNLMRWAEAGYGRVTGTDPEAGAALRIYSQLIFAFAVGVVVGALATDALGIRACWIPAGMIAATLVLSVPLRRSTSTP